MHMVSASDKQYSQVVRILTLALESMLEVMTHTMLLVNFLTISLNITMVMVRMISMSAIWITNN
jgi:hypothetical protein